ncbi:MAG: adventurous gliding motility lipoprotein CglD [Myxococcales bacterium]|nr:adventurous gliding motility lipoprotein CglD [Myxococcales bacterium]
MTIRSLAVASLTALALAGCPVSTDLGQPCILVRKDPSDPTGKRSIAIKEGDPFIKDRAGKDFISFGATACEDFVCVRDSSFARPAGSLDTADAVGYCSRPCVQGSTCPAANPQDNENPATRLSCRPLLLDVETLNAIKQADPQTFTKYFGDTTSPYFCARGKAATDGGTP